MGAQPVLEALDEPLELVAPAGVVGAGESAQLDIHRTRRPGRNRTQIRRRRTTSDTTSPAIIAIADISTQICAGSWDTCRLMNGTAPSNRTTVPSAGPASTAPCWPIRLTR